MSVFELFTGKPVSNSDTMEPEMSGINGMIGESTGMRKKRGRSMGATARGGPGVKRRMSNSGGMIQSALKIMLKKIDNQLDDMVGASQYGGGEEGAPSPEGASAPFRIIGNVEGSADGPTPGEGGLIGPFFANNSPRMRRGAPGGRGMSRRMGRGMGSGSSDLAESLLLTKSIKEKLDMLQESMGAGNSNFYGGARRLTRRRQSRRRH